MNHDLHTYTTNYCEENIYHLAESLVLNDSPSFVIIISNPTKSVPFWLNRLQISHENPGGFVVWDYHVILLSTTSSTTTSAGLDVPELQNGGQAAAAVTVWDYDSAVPFPCPAALYFQSVLKANRSHGLEKRYRRLYRIVSAAAYLAEFASDRSHMLRPDGSYCAPLPIWQPITARTPRTPRSTTPLEPSLGAAQTHETMNLTRLIDVIQEECVAVTVAGTILTPIEGLMGVVVDELELLRFISALETRYPRHDTMQERPVLDDVAQQL